MLRHQPSCHVRKIIGTWDRSVQQPIEQAKRDGNGAARPSTLPVQMEMPNSRLSIEAYCSLLCVSGTSAGQLNYQIVVADISRNPSNVKHSHVLANTLTLAATPKPLTIGF